jgi:hypothetical protein
VNTPSPALPRTVLWQYLLLASAIAAAVLAWWGDAYWNYSDGVYLLTARNLDAGLYSDIAAAQPPPLYWLGGAILTIDDSVLAVRIVLSALAVGSGLLVTVAVWRLTESRTGATLAGLAALVAPWHLHESLTLTPETVAAPLLLGSALLAAGSPRSNLAAGALAGAAACIKLAFALPAAVLALGAAARSRFATAAALTFATLAALSLALYGDALVDNVITAQSQTGTRGLGTTGPLFAQAAWNLGPLLVLAALALWQRARLLDQALLRGLGALVAGELLLLPTVFKVGTSLNLIAVIEPAAIALGASGVIVLLRAERVRTTRLALAAAIACAALVALQSASLVASPEHPRLFARPFSDLAYQRTLSDAQVGAAVSTARDCDRGEAFSGPPYIAFVAERRMPGGQPDTFIVAHAEVHREKAAAAVADAPTCP